MIKNIREIEKQIQLLEQKLRFLVHFLQLLIFIPTKILLQIIKLIGGIQRNFKEVKILRTIYNLKKKMDHLSKVRKNE